MKEKIISRIQDSIKVHIGELPLDSNFSETIDSITFIKMIVALEEEFEFEFEDEMLSVSKINNINDLANYVENHLK